MLRGVFFAGLVLSLGLLRGQQQAEIPLAQAQSLIDQGKLNDAEAGIRQYLETHPDSADAHYLLGYVLFRAGNPKASLAEYVLAAA